MAGGNLFRTPIGAFVLALGLLGADRAQALAISDYVQLVRIPLSGVAIPGGTPADTEAVAVRSGAAAGADTDTVWITGTQGAVGSVFEFEFDTVLGDLIFIQRVGHGFGGDGEGLAFAGGNRLLLSNAPDRPRADSGVYELDATTLQPTGFFASSPADRPEGLGVDPRDLGNPVVGLWIADEGDDRAYEFALDFANGLTLQDSFATNGVERPEGIAVFDSDLLVVDDGRDGNPGRLVQFDEHGVVVDELFTDEFGIFDPQGVDYDPVRDFVYVINDADLQIAGDGPTLVVLTRPGTPTPMPEPGAALAFATQLLVVSAVLRRRARSRTGRLLTRP